MATQSKTKHVLSFTPGTFERCFVVADILEECYGERFLEYGLLGLASRENPLHILATPLLYGQEVTSGSVYQSGHSVLRMRREIQAISRRLKRALVPILFVHRHPCSCEPSGIDHEFATQVFVNHVATLLTFTEMREVEPGSSSSDRAFRGPSTFQARRTSAKRVRVEIEYALCFSMIVNQKREFSIMAVRKEWFPGMSNPQIDCLPAEVRIEPQQSLSAHETSGMRRGLEYELEEKMRFFNAEARGAS